MCEEIDIFSLPFMPSLGYRDLPSDSCVYFLIKGREVLYIGSTVCLGARWDLMPHHRKHLISEEVKIAWLECPQKENLGRWEKKFIHLYQPTFNWQTRKKEHTIKCNLQKWIDELGLNYGAVANALGVDRYVITRLAKNRFERIDCVTWQSVCSYFGKPLSSLFFEEE